MNSQDRCRNFLAKSFLACLATLFLLGHLSAGSAVLADRRSSGTPELLATAPELAVKPLPNTPVLVRLPERRRIPLADWLRLFGGSLEGETSYPSKTKPYDGTGGNDRANAAEGTIEVVARAMSETIFPEEDESFIYWDFTYAGSDIIDVDLVAALPYHKPFARIQPDSQMSGGGGIAQIMVFLGAVDRSNGAVSETVIYDNYTGGTGLPACSRVIKHDPRVALRLHPGRMYRLYVRAWGSAEAYKGANNECGYAEAMDRITVGSIALVPTNGPRIEVTVNTVYPGAYETWDVYERLLRKVFKMDYFPVVGEVHVSIGGQYVVQDSWIRISLGGGGRLTLLRPDLLDQIGVSYQQSDDGSIRLLPPPPVDPTGTLPFRVRVRIDTEIDPAVMSLSDPGTFFGPMKKMWSRLDPMLPEKPAVILPNSRLVGLMDLGYWFVVVPAEEAGTAFNSIPVKAMKQVPVLYAAPPGTDAPRPEVSVWDVREVDWSAIAPGGLRKSGKPLVAINLAALSDLTSCLVAAQATGSDVTSKDERSGSLIQVDAMADNAPAEGYRLAGFTLPSAKTRERVAGKSLKPADSAAIKTAAAGKTMRLAESYPKNGYYAGDPWNQQALLNRLEAVFRSWLRAAAISDDERPQLVLYVDESGKVVTGKTLLEELGEKQALAALRDALAGIREGRPQLMLYHAGDGEIITGQGLVEDILSGEVKKPAILSNEFTVARLLPRVEIVVHAIFPGVPHTNLNGKDFTLSARGVAANGNFAKCVSEDQVGFKSYFDFIPRKPAEVHILVPKLLGVPGGLVPSGSQRGR